MASVVYGSQPLVAKAWSARVGAQLVKESIKLREHMSMTSVSTLERVRGNVNDDG